MATIISQLADIQTNPTSPAAARLQQLLDEFPSPQSNTTELKTNTSVNPTTNTTKQFCTKVRQAIDVTSRSLLLYPSRDTTTAAKRQRIALSFNGGKDCTVVLHLLLAALADCSSSTTTTSTQLIDSILPFYFSTDDVFEEELKFVHSTAAQYFGGEKNLLTMKDVSNTNGVTTLVEQYGIKAFLMGTRSTDPDGKWLNGVFWPSSKGWAPFMRINPCLDWTYRDIWIFLRFFNIDYCSLYDKGYTSIGTKSTSNPNPLLKKEDGQQQHHPAYMLVQSSQERAGRVKKKK